jgi:hypothetical protein
MKRPPTNPCHPDWQQSWEWIEEGSYGKILSRRKCLHPISDTLDPTFNVPFDDARNSQYLRDNLRIAHLSIDHQNQIIALIKRKWGVFRPEGMSIPVLDYGAISILVLLLLFDQRPSTLALGRAKLCNP